MEHDGFITWNSSDQTSKANAISKFSESIDSYDGISKSTGRQYRDFLDLEPNRSVRPGFTPYDYYSFRPDEQVPTQQKRIIKMCMDAYDKVGIIRNVIDLMGDFGCQGINIVHENKSVEDFYQQWFKKIDGKERSERFLNNLYRTGNVLVYRSSANVTPEIVKYIKSVAADIRVEIPEMEKNLIPWRYNFFNPVNVNIKDGKLSIFLGRKNFEINTSMFIDNFKDGSIPANILDTLPPDLKAQIKSGARAVPLDPDRLCVFYYKKDDWNQWANPMTYAILDDIIMLEKMRLADMSALDGAISNIRLWTLGNLDHQILPTKSAINKLRNILASNVGGGTMELVWGPELSYTESNSQVYKFLGSEKYQSVLNSIYAGLGVPPTLTGMAGNGGGFTNNFISLKTLVERLQYGRDLLIRFWEKEVEIVRKAMGFRKSPHIVFDQMSLSDESSEKQLLIQLADRDIISHETILERFKEIPGVERVRLKREQGYREADKMPEKVSPFIKPESQIPGLGFDPPMKSANPQGGRPLNKQDEGPRKQRTETPKSKPGVAELFVWTQTAYEQISDLVNNAYLGVKNKKNLRQLTKAEVSESESIKLAVLTSIDIFSEVSNEKINKVIASNKNAPKDFQNHLKTKKIDTFSMTMDDYKKQVIANYIEYVCDKNEVF
jgi:hypothetical protein